MMPVILLLVSVLGAGHPVLARIDNINLPLMEYAIIRARDAGIDEGKFLKLIDCESAWNKNAKGDWRKDMYMAKNLLQFWPNTFYSYQKKYGLEGGYNNPYSQINLASLMIRDGGAYHWKVCSKRVELL